MAENTGTITHSVVSATSKHKRDVAETLRRLEPSITQTLALVRGSNVDAYGKVGTDGRGLIDKRGCKRMDPERFVYDPVSMVYTATGGSATTAVIADTSMFQTGDTIINLATWEAAVVNTITSGTTLTVTAVNGTWSCAADNVICMAASSFEEGTARYATISREPSRIQTNLQIFREGVAMADTMKKIEEFLSEGGMKFYQSEKMLQALKKLENSFIASKQGSSGTTSVTIAGTAYPLYTMKGIKQWSSSSIPMSGSFSWDTWNRVLYTQMPKTINATEKLYMLCGTKIASEMNMWATNSYLTMGDNAGKSRFGIKTKTYLMGGHLEVEPIIHNLFDNAALSNSALFFQSSDIEYLFYNGMDLNIRENAQLPAAMNTTNIIEGVIGCFSKSNGANIVYASDLLAA